ncbi:hypothetical protein EIP91_008122 [Steccherinum ochraceum]|uniref:Fungal-type protein kinase domain-containing protein n=1 Tax=Steccherinum ochraceum TaxID=92696 RepID=A0A4R0RH49_9APHY|nr:hypothetical protein EIP91_008122 [Steccherinum ochraceum]
MATTPPGSLTPEALAALAQDTPRTPKPADASKPHETQRRQMDHLLSSGTRWVETPFDTFLDNYAPSHDATEPKYFKSKQDLKDEGLDIDLTFFDVKTRSRKNEKITYAPTIEFMNKALSDTNGAAILKCMDVADWPDKTGSFTGNADIMIYGVPCTGQPMWEDPSLEPGPTIDEERRPHVARGAFGHVKIGVENKVSNKGFGCELTDDFLSAGVEAEKTQGQLAQYAAEIQLRQHRTFVFMISIYRTFVRIIRFDRVGGIVTECIDLRTDSHKLYEFLHRIKSFSDRELGYDPTATMLPNDIENADLNRLNAAISALPSDSRVTPFIQNAFGGEQWPVYELEVPVKNDPKNRQHFLVRNLSTSTQTPLTGRATKGYIAFDLSNDSFCFLKASWRADSEEIRSELEVYKHLEPFKIRGIATVVCGGDLPASTDQDCTQLQSTETQNAHPSRIYLPRIHTRLVLKEIGVPLKYFDDFEELSQTVFWAYKAHRDAWEKAGVLHRDISDGNVVIYETDKVVGGLLIDWDLCKFASELAHLPPRITQKNRSGTWRFFSGVILKYPFGANEVADDIESFYQLLLLFGLRFHQHNRDEVSIKGILEDYDSCTCTNGIWVGKETKFDNISSGQFPTSLTFKDDAFSRILVSLCTLCQQHYASLDLNELERYKFPAAKTTSSEPPEPRARDKRDTGRALMLEGEDLEYADDDENDSYHPYHHRPPPTLNTHAPFMRVFVRAFTQLDQWDPSRMCQKQADLFATIKWNATAITNGSASRTSTKRSSDVFSSESLNLQPRKKKKKPMRSSSSVGSVAGPSRPVLAGTSLHTHEEEEEVHEEVDGEDVPAVEVE